MVTIDDQKIHDIAHFTPISDRKKGISCRFIKIDENWGIKFYQDEAMRNKTLDFQNRAANAGLAPRVGKCFELELPFYEGDEPIEVFGYVTECISETYGDKMAHDLFGITRDQCHSTQSDEIYSCLYSDYEYNQLISDIEDIGITTKDIHIMNVGYLGDKLVCIDFSEETEIATY